MTLKMRAKNYCSVLTYIRPASAARMFLTWELVELKKDTTRELQFLTLISVFIVEIFFKPFPLKISRIHIPWCLSFFLNVVTDFIQ